jgi:hypothetical protein
MGNWKIYYMYIFFFSFRFVLFWNSKCFSNIKTYFSWSTARISACVFGWLDRLDSGRIGSENLHKLSIVIQRTRFFDVCGCIQALFEKVFLFLFFFVSFLKTERWRVWSAHWTRDTLVCRWWTADELVALTQRERAKERYTVTPGRAVKNVCTKYESWYVIDESTDGRRARSTLSLDLPLKSFQVAWYTHNDR